MCYVFYISVNNTSVVVRCPYFKTIKFIFLDYRDERNKTRVVRCFIWLKKSVLVSITVLFNLCCDTVIKVIAMIT